MAKDNERFVRTFRQGNFGGTIEIWVDTQTGVNYLYRSSGYGAGMTPLLNAEGRPVVSSVRNNGAPDWMK